MNFVFDFDSTIIEGESLEMAILSALENYPQSESEKILTKISAITNDGMNGKISPLESLKKRLDLVPINENHIKKAALLCKEEIIEGMEKLISKFQNKKVAIYIASGAPLKCIIPTAEKLKIKKENIRASNFVFENGKLQLENLTKDKIDMVKSLNIKASESVMIGDGFTDLEIWQKGLVKEFICFTECVERKETVKKAKIIAKNITQLDKILDSFL